MKKFDDELHLSHILKAVRRIIEYTHEMSREIFDADYRTQDAVIRPLEIIGEATKRISPDLRAKYQLIPWRGMAGMRDILIHQYDEADYDIVWKTAAESIPKMQNDLEMIDLEELPEQK